MSNTPESNKPIFKIDNREINVGQDIRVEYTVDGDSKSFVNIVLTHEGLIIDWWQNGVHVDTYAQTFDELSTDLKPHDDWVE